jgi:Alternative complex III, ActD subunit
VNSYHPRDHYNRNEDKNKMANSVVFGIYSTREQVESAVEEMKREGFRNADVSVLFPHNEGTKDFALEKGTKAPEGAAAGATSGAVIGGTLGWLAGLGMLAIPGLGPFIAAGPIMALLSGVGVGAAVGGLTGALIGMGIPEYLATRYEGRIKGGCILLSVHADDSDWIKKAKRIFERTGANDISSTAETKGDYANTDTPKDRMSA